MSDFEDDAGADFEDDAGEWSDLDEDEDEHYNMAADLISVGMANEFNDYGDTYDNEVAEQHKSIRQVISLKDNCLDCITKNFDRFNNAYLLSEDAVLRRNLEFLQRVYSSRVIQSLSGRGWLKDRHLQYLINEYLKELELRLFVKSGCSLKAIEKRIVVVGNGFTKVSFDFPFCILEDSISEFLNTIICHLSNVEVLHLLQKCNDTTLKNISSFCTKLSELNIDGSSNVTVKGLEMLCKKEEEDKTECLIKILSIRDITALDSAITFLLNNMPHLEVLNYNNLPTILHSMHKEDLKNNTLNSVKKYNLTKLDFLYSSHILQFNESTIDDPKAEVLNVWVELCPNIKTVCINFSNEDCLNLISRFASLENLTVGYVFDTAVGNRIEFNNFFKSNGIKLKNLQIDGFVLSVPVLVESCPKLQNLVLTDVQFQSLEKNPMKGQPSNKKSLHSLSDLCLVDITFSDQYAEDSVSNILLSSPNLKKLSFELCKFENSEMNTKLAKYCEDSTLQHLRFYNCNIDIALLESIILTCSSLISLTIDSCEKIRSDEAYNLHQLRDTARSFVKIVYTNYESDDNTINSNEFEFYDDIYSEYEHEDSDDYDLDDDPLLWYANDFW